MGWTQVANIKGPEGSPTPRSDSTTSSATPTIDTDDIDIYGLTAQVDNITSFTTNLSGTPVDGQKLWIYIISTQSITIAWGDKFEDGAMVLPLEIIGIKRLDVGFVWNPISTKWRCMASGSR